MHPLQKDNTPSIYAELQTDIPISDSCNCCQTCNVNCCFPRRTRKHRKDCKEKQPNMDRRASIIDEKSKSIFTNEKMENN